MPPINPNIPLQTTTVDPSAGINRLAQGIQIGQERKEKKADREQQRKLRDLQIATASFELLDQREKNRVGSTIMGAARAKPFLDEGNAEAAARVFRARKDAIQEQKEQFPNLPIDDNDSQMFLDLIEGGEIEKAQQLADQFVELGQATGVLEAAEDGFTLSAGQTRFDAQGNPIAENPEEQIRTLSPEETQQAGFPEGTVVQVGSDNEFKVKHSPSDPNQSDEKISSFSQALVDEGMNPDEAQKTAAGFVNGQVELKLSPSTSEVFAIDKVKLASGQEDAVTSLPIARPTPEFVPSESGETAPGSQATGAKGALRNISNILTDAFGAGLTYENADQATNALNELSTRTIIVGGSDIEGRPNKFMQEKIEKLTVKPNSLLRGEDSAKNQLIQTRDMLSTQLETIENNVLPLTLSQGAREKALIKRAQLSSLVQRYNEMIDGFNKQGDIKVGGFTVEEVEE